MLDFGNVAQNLAAYGLATVLWIPGRGEGNDKIQIGGGKARPLIRVSDVETFRKTFPGADGIIVASLDGQSIRVAMQSKIRAGVEKDRNVSDGDLVVAQLQRLAGIRAAAPATPSALSDDSLIAELARRKGISLEDAQALFA